MVHLSSRVSHIVCCALLSFDTAYNVCEIIHSVKNKVQIAKLLRRVPPQCHKDEQGSQKEVANIGEEIIEGTQCESAIHSMGLCTQVVIVTDILIPTGAKNLNMYKVNTQNHCRDAGR